MTEWCWGVDVSSRRIAFGALPVGSGGLPCSWSLDIDPGLRGAERLTRLRRAIIDYTTTVTPSAIVVENPINVNGAFVLLTCTGVVMESLYATYGCPVLELAVGKWKKEVLGHGHSSKEACMAHAYELGGHPDNQDEADALCVAEAARNRLAVAR